MAQMNISIPEKLKSWAEARVAEGRSLGRPSARSSEHRVETEANCHFRN